MPPGSTSTPGGVAALAVFGQRRNASAAAPATPRPRATGEIPPRVVDEVRELRMMVEGRARPLPK